MQSQAVHNSTSQYVNYCLLHIWSVNVITGVVPGYRRGDQFDAHEFLLCLITQIEHDSRLVDCLFTFHCLLI